MEERKLLAYRSKAGCRNVTCTRDSRQPDRCFGWHCGSCDAPTSMQGHACPDTECLCYCENCAHGAHALCGSTVLCRGA